MASTFPDKIDSLAQYMNVSSVDATLLKNYQTAIQSGDLTLANQYLVQIENYDKKIITAEKLNAQASALIATEKFYKDDIKPYTEQKQTEWQTVINQFGYNNRYSSVKEYKKNNMVLYNDGSYDAIYIYIYDTSSVGNLPINTTYWRKLTIQGARGKSSSQVNTVFAGNWTRDIDYDINSIVICNNSWWYSLKANINQLPQFNSEYWEHVMEIEQSLYVVQTTEPTTQKTGDLWFEVIG